MLHLTYMLHCCRSASDDSDSLCDEYDEYTDDADIDAEIADLQRCPSFAVYFTPIMFMGGHPRM